jgi:hypothetical protein
VEVLIDFHLHLCYLIDSIKGQTLTQTPSTPQELINLNQQKDEVTKEQILDLMEKLTPVQTILVTRLMLSRLSGFHWDIVEGINSGEIEQPLQPWVHDSTIISNCLQQFENLTDFNN